MAEIFTIVSGPEVVIDQDVNPADLRRFIDGHIMAELMLRCDISASEAYMLLQHS